MLPKEEGLRRGEGIHGLLHTANGAVVCQLDGVGGKGAVSQAHVHTPALGQFHLHGGAFTAFLVAGFYRLALGVGLLELLLQLLNLRELGQLALFVGLGQGVTLLLQVRQLLAERFQLR